MMVLNRLSNQDSNVLPVNLGHKNLIKHSVPGHIRGKSSSNQSVTNLLNFEVLNSIMFFIKE
jgi:hypothetical protein